MIDAHTFEELLKDREKLFEVSWEELKALSQQYPYSAHVWWLMLEKARLEQRPDYDQILEHVASRTFDRAFLYHYLRHLQTHASPLAEHFQLGEDYLELKDLSELEALEATTPADGRASEDSQAHVERSEPAAEWAPAADEETEEVFDESERFTSLDEVFQFPEALSSPFQKEPDTPDTHDAPPISKSSEPPFPADSMQGRVLSLDDLLAELPQDAVTPASEKEGEADTKPSSEVAEAHPAGVPAAVSTAEQGKAEPPVPPAEAPRDDSFQQAGALAAAGVHTALQVLQWVPHPTRQAQSHSPAIPPQRSAPLARQQFASWNKLVQNASHHLSISSDSEVEKPPLRHPEKSKKRKEKKDLSSPERIARQSLSLAADVASEPLARIFERQGHYERAIIMYEQLRLKYPEKSDFFAAKIEELKQKL